MTPIVFSFFLIAYVAAAPFYGLNYGIDQNNCPDSAHYAKDFNALKQYTNIVRTYTISPCNQGPMALQAAQDAGMGLYLGMWIDRPDTFEKESAILQQMLQGNTSGIEAIIVGSEAMYRNDTDAATMVEYINQVKNWASPHHIPVTTSDVYYKFTESVIDAVDFVAMNAFPYWEGVSVDTAASTLADHYNGLVGQAKGKSVIVSETGWPSAGSNFGNSVPSPANARQYLLNILCWASQNNVNVIYYEGIDEQYKQDVEANFGVLDSNLQLKAPVMPADLANPCQG